MKGRRRTPMTVNIKDVAQHLGVSPSTVSRVLNDHPDTSAAMRDRVLSAARELGYRPDFRAQSLRGGLTRTIGFALRDLSNPIFADIVKGAETRLREANHALILANSEGDPDLDVHNISILDQRHVDGLLLSLQSETGDDLEAALNNLEVPVVLIDRTVEAINAGAVLSDHRSGVRAATRHLLELGHRRIAFISGPHDIRATRDRLLGFDDAFAQFGVSPEPDLIRLGSYSREFGHAETLSLMSQQSRPTAILSAGVQSTAGVLAAGAQLGLRLGHDYAFVSCDEIDLMAFIDPPISVIRRDAVMIGRTAAEVLLAMIADDSEPQHITLPTEYVSRGSTSPPPN